MSMKKNKKVEEKNIENDNIEVKTTRVEKAKSKNKKKNKKKKFPYGPKEKLFNILSFILCGSIGLYYGGRLVYFYTAQHVQLKEDAYTLNGSVLSTIKTVTEGDGLHQDQDGYYFKGNVENNYVKFANRTFRIMRVNNDNTVKLITEDIASEFMWGDDFSYVNSNLDKWLDKKDGDNTGIYYDTLPSPTDFLVKTNYNQMVFDGKKITDGKDKLSTYITTLSIKDYSNANGKNSYLNNGKYFWLIGVDSEDGNYFVSEDGSLLVGSSYETYGVRPVVTMKADTAITGGDGTKDNPFVVNQDGKTNLVDSYVKIGQGTWKVYAEKDNVVKLAYLDTIGARDYGGKSSYFDTGIRGSIANYLNNDWYYGLMYKDHMLDMTLYTGEVSADTSLDMSNIYNESETVKVGLLNAFDYNNLGIDNYFLSNTTSSVGSMVYVYHNYGLLGEAKVTEEKSIVPTIALSKDDIVTSEGNGSKDKPFGVR